MRTSPVVSPVSCTSCSPSLTTPVNSWQNEGTKRTLDCRPGRSQALGRGNDRQLLTTAVICWQRRGGERARGSGPPASWVRHTFATHLSKNGVPRTAQAAMRRSSLDLTMNVHNDPSLLDVSGALATLPDLSLQDVAQADAGTGKSGAGSHPR